MLKTSVAFLIYFLRCSDCIFISLCELYDFSVRPLDVLHINCWLTALLFANNTGCWQLLCHRILNHPNHPKEPPWIQNQQHHRADWAINTQQHFAEHVPCFSTLAAFFTHMEKKKTKNPNIKSSLSCSTDEPLQAFLPPDVRASGDLSSQPHKAQGMW